MDPIDEIKAIYHATTARTIQKDLARAIALLKTLETEEEREKPRLHGRPRADAVGMGRSSAPSRARGHRRVGERSAQP